MALALALFAIVVVSAIMVGTFYAANQESRIGRNEVQDAGALAAAELGQNRVISEWNRRLAEYKNMKTGDTLYRDSSDAAGWGYRAIVTRLNTNTYWLVSEGRVNVGTTLEARRRTNLVLRIVYPKINFLGGLTTAGALTMTGASTLNGLDANPTGWNCPAPGAAVAGLATSDTATSSDKLSGGATITGSPTILRTAAAADSTNYLRYGTDTWNSLTAMANITIPGGNTVSAIGPTVTATGACDISNTNNWGDPNRALIPGPCESYFPIVYGSGNLKISGGGVGQGVLLIAGDLTISGGFTWFGPVIVKGSFTSTGGAMHVTGGVMAEDASVAADTTSTIVGSSGIQYSHCAVITALKSTAQPALASERAWADMF